jgi:hypothetical protein
VTLPPWIAREKDSNWLNQIPVSWFFDVAIQLRMLWIRVGFPSRNGEEVITGFTTIVAQI